MAATISEYSESTTKEPHNKQTLVNSYRLAIFKGAQIPVDVQLQLESWTQLLALNVEKNTYRQFHGTCPFLQRNCKRFKSSCFGLLGGGGRSRLGIKLSLRILKEESNIRFWKKGSLLMPLTVTVTVKGVNISSRRE